jgi:hypothetical protein
MSEESENVQAVDEFPTTAPDPAVGAYPLAQLIRETTPVRVAFLHPPRAKGGPGPLAKFVSQRRGTALDLLLLAHTISPLATGGEIVAPSSDWTRVLGTADRPGRRAAVSRSWDWLDAEHFVTARRAGQFRSIKVLREDGSGRPWSHPAENNEPFFPLPNSVWQSGLWASFLLPAKAVLLIALSLQSRGEDYFELPIERGSDWYGLGARTVRSGLNQLHDAGLLRRWSEKWQTGNSTFNYAYTRRYALNESRI